MSQFHKNQKKIKNLEILFRRETFSGSLRLWVSRKNNFGCWVILSCRLVLYFSAETNEKEINVENQKSEKSREIFQPAERSLLTCGNFNPFSTWRGDVWFDLESFLNDLIDDRRIWPFWTFLEHFPEGFYVFFLLRVLREGHICIEIGIGNGSYCLKISQTTLISIGTLVGKEGRLFEGICSY